MESSISYPIHVFTFCTDTTRTADLAASAKLFGFFIHYITSNEWIGYMDKIIGMRNAVESLPDNAIVCFIDAYDVLVNDTMKSLLDKFLALKTDLILGAELGCYPDRYRSKFSNRVVWNKSRATKETVTTNYLYLNSGGYIGYKHAVLRCLYWKPDWVILHLCADGGDQAYFIEYYLAHSFSTSIGLDHECSIFQNMHLVDWSDIQFRNGHMENIGFVGVGDIKTPVFIHFNGGTWQSPGQGKVLMQSPGHQGNMQNIMPIFVQKIEGSRISPSPLTLSQPLVYTQILTKTCFPILQQMSSSMRTHHKTVLNYLDSIYYINLDRRKDRLRNIQQELFAYGIYAPNVCRFAAIDRPEPGKGIVGCTCSHLAVLREARERNYSSVLIFEDDFEFCVSADIFYENLCKLFYSGIEYNVCMLAYKLEDSREIVGFGGTFLRKVLAASNASAYIVHSSMYDRLISLYEWAIPLLDETNEHWIYANDQVWKRLQCEPDVKWYAFIERIGRQSCGYSDNAESYMEYDC